MASRWQRLALLAPPALAVSVVAIGLRLGASRDVMAAGVFAAPPGKARHGLAWTVRVLREDRGVREPVPNRPIAVHAKARDGRDVHWEGSTDEAGVAEVWLPLEGIAPGDRVELRVQSGDVTLADGTALVPEPRVTERYEQPRYLPAARREGAILLDVLIPGGALATEFPSRVLVHALDAATHLPRAGTHLLLEPEPGLATDEQEVVTCQNGWASLLATAQVHVVGAAIHAHASDGMGGEWYGAWPTSGGAFYVALPNALRANAGHETYVTGPGMRRHVYVEIDDEAGRAAAYSLDLKADPAPLVGVGVGTLRAPLTLPAMAPGLAWIVTSSDPSGAESLSGSTLATPIVVGPKDVTGASFDACALWPELAGAEAHGFSTSLVLDGFVPLRAASAAARRRGLGLALTAVVLSALVETILLLRQARRARLELEHAREVAGEPARRWIDGRSGAIAVGLGIALLGFALLGALLVSAR